MYSILFTPTRIKINKKKKRSETLFNFRFLLVLVFVRSPLHPKFIFTTKLYRLHVYKKRIENLFYLVFCNIEYYNIGYKIQKKTQVG